MRVFTSQCPDDIFEYLHETDRNRGHGASGAYARAGGGGTESPRAGRVAFTVWGAVLLAVAVVPTFLPGTVLTLGSATWLPYVQAIFAAIGALLLVAARVRAGRPEPAAIGAFLLADGAGVYSVTPAEVEFHPWGDVPDADGSHRFMNGIYAGSDIRVRLGALGPTVTLSAYDRDGSEKLIGFVGLFGKIRSSDDMETRATAFARPGRAAAFAALMVRSQGQAHFDGSLDYPDPPVPTPPEGGFPVPRAFWGRRLSAAIVAAGIGLVALPLLNAASLERHHAGLALKAYGDATGPHDEYLAAFPEGKSVTAVTEDRDDRLFRVAERAAAERDSPRPARDYLADRRNTRHVPAAQAIIDKHYDAAIRDLRERAAKPGAGVDPTFLNGLVALLESLKKSGRPVATLGFRPTVQAEPAPGEEAEREAAVRDARVAAEPRLKALTGPLILATGDAFTPAQVEARQRVILERLQDALSRGIKADVLTLEAAPAGEAAAIEVGYRVRPTGGLYLYNFRDASGAESVKGLIRGYDIGWDIAVRPPGAAEPFAWKLESQPLNQLNYARDPSDPDWAPYAIVLFSGFHDLSDRLIRQFGLDPGPAPDRFTFAAAASTEVARVPVAAPGVPAATDREVQNILDRLNRQNDPVEKMLDRLNKKDDAVEKLLDRLRPKPGVPMP